MQKHSGTRVRRPSHNFLVWEPVHGDSWREAVHQGSALQRLGIRRYWFCILRFLFLETQNYQIRFFHSFSSKSLEIGYMTTFREWFCSFWIDCLFVRALSLSMVHKQDVPTVIFFKIIMYCFFFVSSLSYVGLGGEGGEGRRRKGEEEGRRRRGRGGGGEEEEEEGRRRGRRGGGGGEEEEGRRRGRRGGGGGRGEGEEYEERVRRRSMRWIKIVRI